MTQNDWSYDWLLYIAPDSRILVFTAACGAGKLAQGVSPHGNRNLARFDAA